MTSPAMNKQEDHVSKSVYQASRGSKYPLLTTRQVARRLGMSEDYMVRLRGVRPYVGPPFFKLGRCVKYSLPQLDCWIEDESGRQATERQQGELSPQELQVRLTRAVRKADEVFERVGGSSRHWVRDCFLAALEEENLKIVEGEPDESR